MSRDTETNRACEHLIEQIRLKHDPEYRRAKQSARTKSGVRFAQLREVALRARARGLIRKQNELGTEGEQ